MLNTASSLMFSRVSIFFAGLGNILTEDEVEEIKNKITYEVLKENKSYEDALEDGKKDLLAYLKRK